MLLLFIGRVNRKLHNCIKFKNSLAYLLLTITKLQIMISTEIAFDFLKLLQLSKFGFCKIFNNAELRPEIMLQLSCW